MITYLPWPSPHRAIDPTLTLFVLNFVPFPTNVPARTLLCNFL